MLYSTVITPKGSAIHASRDGAHPICDRSEEGMPVDPSFSAAGYVSCRHCSRRMPATANWSGNMAQQKGESK